MKHRPPTFSGSNVTEEPQRFNDSLERLWRALGCSDIRAVELSSFQLEGVAYDWFDTVSRGRPAGSPPLAWGEFSQLFMARFLPESVRDQLVYEFERFVQTQGMSVSEYSARFTQLSRYAPYPITEEERIKRFIKGLQEYIFRSVVGSKCSTFAEVLSLALQLEQRQKEKRGTIPDSRKKQRVEGSYSNFPSYGSGHVHHSQGQQRPVSQRGGSSGQSSGTMQSHRSNSWGSSHSTFPQRHASDTSTPCSACGRFHAGTCLGDDKVCYQCGQTSHIRRNCPTATRQPSSSHASAPAALAPSQAPSTAVRPMGSSSGRGFGASQHGGRGSGGRGQMQAVRGQARVFALTRQDAEASNAVVTGILSVCSHDARVLFDPGATHSFVSLCFASRLGKSSSLLEETLVIATPVGGVLLAEKVYRSCDISVGGKDLSVDLVVLDMVDFDVILGMDWLASHHATLDCHNKVVKFEIPGESIFSFQGEHCWVPVNLISTLGASKLLRKGCQGYLALVRDIQVDGAKVESVPVACEFSDVFPEELPGLPPDREI